MLHAHSRRIVAGALASLLLSGGVTAAMANDVASTLESDGRFSKFVWAYKSAGLWPRLKQEKSITVFAPTNDAFDALGRNWRNLLVPASPADDGADPSLLRERLQSFVMSTEIGGAVPEDLFKGRVSRVRAVYGTYFTVDGTQPGGLMLNPRPVTQQATIGFAWPTTKTVTAGAPIAADNGLIYPTSGFVGTYRLTALIAGRRQLCVTKRIEPPGAPVEHHKPLISSLRESSPAKFLDGWLIDRVDRFLAPAEPQRNRRRERRVPSGADSPLQSSSPPSHIPERRLQPSRCDEGSNELRTSTTLAVGF